MAWLIYTQGRWPQASASFVCPRVAPKIARILPIALDLFAWARLFEYNAQGPSSKGIGAGYWQNTAELP